MANEESPLGGAAKAKKDAPTTAPAESFDDGSRWARVKAPAVVHAKGQQYNLPKGEVISSKDYDFTALENQGVELEVGVPAPRWWVNAQREAAEKAAAAAGKRARGA